jgi:hypothetical protein
MFDVCGWIVTCNTCEFFGGWMAKCNIVYVPELLSQTIPCPNISQQPLQCLVLLAERAGKTCASCGGNRLQVGCLNNVLL